MYLQSQFQHRQQVALQYRYSKTLLLYYSYSNAQQAWLMSINSGYNNNTSRVQYWHWYHHDSVSAGSAGSVTQYWCNRRRSQWWWWSSVSMVTSCAGCSVIIRVSSLLVGLSWRSTKPSLVPCPLTYYQHRVAIANTNVHYNMSPCLDSRTRAQVQLLDSCFCNTSIFVHYTVKKRLSNKKNDFKYVSILFTWFIINVANILAMMMILLQVVNL